MISVTVCVTTMMCVVLAKVHDQCDCVCHNYDVCCVGQGP